MASFVFGLLVGSVATFAFAGLLACKYWPRDEDDDTEPVGI